MTDGDGEFASQTTELQRVLIRLQVLRNADDNLVGRGRPTWDAARRLAVFTECCRDRGPLLEVMNTTPPYVLIGQADTTGATPGDGDRAPWEGVGRHRGNTGLTPLDTFEAMAGTRLKYWTWCRCRRWYVSDEQAPPAVVGEAGWVPLADVLSQGHRVIGRHARG